MQSFSMKFKANLKISSPTATAILVALISLSAVNTQAEDSKWALPLSASVGIGSMQDSKMDLKSRTMSALSIEALPSYRLGQWMLGAHLDYRWQGQVTGLEAAGGTNLKGRGYLIGLGARYNFTDRFFAQTSVDFLGQYDFDKQTYANEEDGLRLPLGIRVKSGYAFIEKIPNLTFDIDLQYLTFKKIHISHVESDADTNQLMASVGVTYQFGKKTPAENPEVPSEASKNPTQIEAPQTVPHKDIKDPTPASGALAFNLSGNNFDFRSSDLKPEAKVQLKKAAEAILKNPSVNVLIQGHTDSSGNAKRNDKLSLRRADSVKAFLVEQGVEESRISTEGLGSAKPVADNNTEKGRAQNRRVEIYFVKGEP